MSELNRSLRYLLAAITAASCLGTPVHIPSKRPRGSMSCVLSSIPCFAAGHHLHNALHHFEVLQKHHLEHRDTARGHKRLVFSTHGRSLLKCKEPYTQYPSVDLYKERGPGVMFISQVHTLWSIAPAMALELWGSKQRRESGDPCDPWWRGAGRAGVGMTYLAHIIFYVCMAFASPVRYTVHRALTNAMSTVSHPLIQNDCVCVFNIPHTFV